MNNFVCSECGHASIPFSLNGIAYEFCPSCRKIEVKTSIIDKDWRKWEKKYMNHCKHNKMGEVAEILDLELNQEFSITYKNTMERLRITERGIERFISRDEEWVTCEIISLEDLITGRYEIKPAPFKPQSDTIYYYLSDNELPYEDGNYEFYVKERVWSGNLTDLQRFYSGNCFRTRTEAEVSKEKIFDKILRNYLESV